MTNTLLGFIAGLIVGGMLGVLVMALCGIARNGDYENEMSELRQRKDDSNGLKSERWRSEENKSM